MEKRETQLINRITYFTFQLCRKTQTHYLPLEKDNTNINLVTLENQLNDLLFSLKGYLFIVEYQEEKNKYLNLLSYLFKLIAYTRDIYDGKGERDLTYTMITVWYKHFPKLAMYIFEQICSSYSTNTNTTFGSWKDAKYLCQYIKKNTKLLSEEKQEKCIQDIIQIMNNQLHIDFIHQNNLSLISKWIPREKSKFGWLYESLAKNWNEKFEKPDPNPNTSPYQSYKKYRKIVSSLNQKLNTTQIKQCERKSNEIDYYHVSLITKHKNEYYFLQNPTNTKTQNKTQNPKPILNYDIGELCREHYPEKSANILLWGKIRENILSTKSNQKKYFLPILDMTSKNVEDGIAISILLSEISEITNRILTYDQKQAIWISLENTLSLYEKKRQIKNHTIMSELPVTDKPRNTVPDNKKQKYSIIAIEYIINSIIETKLPLEQIEDMYLVFISDFQRLEEETKELDHHSLIQKTFRENGIAKIPKIIYWNISTEIVRILPCSPTTPNVYFLAGTASSNFHHLFEFSNHGQNNPESESESTTIPINPINPFSYYKKVLNQHKYQRFERYLKISFS